ncbi:uncharacterized protein LOC116257032 isoform X1 [Nymphaea colorata]|nr:uncharacterized protein LOC116257032 isoform X1 [Nymphaea colorata]
MEATKWVESEASSNSDVEDEESEDEELSYMSITIPSLQIRTAKVSIARWDPKLGMGEVVQKKGGMWRTTGIVRDSKVYCLMEEIMYMAERGALLLLNDDASYLHLKDIYNLVTQGLHGCSWKCFEVYRHLKALGYVVGRHGLLWTTKCKGTSSLISSANCEHHLESENLKSEGDSAILTELFSVLDISSCDALKVSFDVYLPNKQFKKSAPGDPGFMLCVAGEIPPTIVQVENLRKQSGDIPIKFAHVDHGRVSIFSYNKVELPILP